MFLFLNSLLIFENFLLFIFFGLIFIIIKNCFESYIKGKRLPPGPIGLPILGYLPFLGKEPHKTFIKLEEKYGNVFTVKLGVHNIVILNNWAAVKEAFHKDELLGRPDYSPFSIAGGGRSFVDLNGNTWREHRRFYLQLLRDQGFGTVGMEARIIEEIGHLCKRIDAANGQAFSVNKLLMPNMSNNICQLVFGHRFDYDDPRRTKLDKTISSMSKLFSSIGVFAITPKWMAKLIYKILGFDNRKNVEVAIDIFNEEISKHKQVFDENKIHDYIDGYLAQMRKGTPQSNFTFTETLLQPNCFALFGAGSETVKTTMNWALMTIVHYVEHQKKIQKEIDCVIGRDRMPSFADLKQMPFTQAFINELFRWKTIVPLNLMRRTLVDTTVQNHFIPKDTYVLANIWAVHNDSNTWDNPEVFNPNRFLSEDGNKYLNHECVIPFSIGKRNCVGEALGRIEVFLYFVSLLQRYSISAPNNKVFTFEENIGLIAEPKEKVVLKFEKRV